MYSAKDTDFAGIELRDVRDVRNGCTFDVSFGSQKKWLSEFLALIILVLL